VELLKSFKVKLLRSFWFGSFAVQRQWFKVSKPLARPVLVEAADGVFVQQTALISSISYEAASLPVCTC
jgi:hypothetical protein